MTDTAPPETRLAHAERVLRAAIAQIRTDEDLLFDGCPPAYLPTHALSLWDEYKRVHGIGRKP